MTLVKRFLAAWREVQSQAQYDEIADLPHGWTEGDANWLQTIFRQESGKQLKKRLSNLAFRASILACQPYRKDSKEQEGGDYRRGRAQGVVDAIQAIEQHMNPDLYRQEQDLTSVEDVNSTSFGTEEPAPAL